MGVPSLPRLLLLPSAVVGKNARQRRSHSRGLLTVFVLTAVFLLHRAVLFRPSPRHPYFSVVSQPTTSETSGAVEIAPTLDERSPFSRYRPLARSGQVTLTLTDDFFALSMETIDALWPSARVYLPMPDEAIHAFELQQEKLQRSGKVDIHPVANVPPTFWLACIRRVPECLFFMNPESGVAATKRRGRVLAYLAEKCCIEHTQLQTTLRYVASVAATQNLSIFFMFGSLLSIARDGWSAVDNGGGLVPWETDIDLGIIGASPSMFADALLAHNGAPSIRRTFEESIIFTNSTDGNRFETHVCKTSGNAKDSKRVGTCSDVHSVQLVEQQPAGDASSSAKVELWPYRLLKDMNISTMHRRNARQLGKKHMNLSEVYASFFRAGTSSDERTSDVFETVRRSELVLPVDMVVPLKRSIDITEDGGNFIHRRSASGVRRVACALWGIALTCPAQSVSFLDLEYHGRRGWAVPKTIHWGDNNARGWR